MFIKKGVCHTEVSFVGIEASRKAVDVSRGISTSAATSNGREAREHGGLFALGRKERRGRYIGPVAVGGECSVGACASSVNSAFRYLEKNIYEL